MSSEAKPNFQNLQQLEEYMDWLDEVFPEHEPFVVDCLLPGEEDGPAVLMWEDDTDA